MSMSLPRCTQIYQSTNTCDVSPISSLDQERLRYFCVLSHAMQSLLQFRQSRQHVQQWIDQGDSTWAAWIAENGKASDEQSSGVIDAQESGNDALITVEFRDNDAHNPRCWSFWRRVFTTVIVLSTGVVGGWASSNDSTIVPQAMKSFGVGEIVESLATGLYLVAFGVG